MTAHALADRTLQSVRVIEGRLSSRPRIASWVLYTVVFAVVFFGLIFSQTRLNQSALTIQEIEKEIAIEREMAEDLRLQVARLQSPARVQPAADELGMVFPSSLETLTASGVVTTDELVLPERTQILSAP